MFISLVEVKRSGTTNVGSFPTKRPREEPTTLTCCVRHWHNVSTVEVDLVLNIGEVDLIFPIWIWIQTIFDPF